MKKPQAQNKGKLIPMDFFNPQKLISLVLFFLVMAGFNAYAQTLPVVTVRFNNPSFNCETGTYCLDVEFLSDTPDKQLYGINVRFWYDDDVLEFLSMGDYAQGYGAYDPDPPEITSYSAGSGSAFGFPGPAEFLNGAVRLLGSTDIYLSTDPQQWTKIFNVCFEIDDPTAFDIENFCPSIVWDLEEDPANGGFITGSDGVVISVVAPPPDDSSPTTENVVQHNWVYDGVPGLPFGEPAETLCITTICDFADFGDAPEGNWAYPMPDLGVMGAFPTCIDPTVAPGFISHVVDDNPAVFFGPSVDAENDGNASACSPYSPYNNDECYADGDAGLINPASPYTINDAGNYVTCVGPGDTLCNAGDTVYWGADLDIFVTNFSPQDVFVNVLVDWNRNGMWDFDPTNTVKGNVIHEHSLVNFPVPPGFSGALSTLAPPPIYSGKYKKYMWARFSITEVPVNQDWDGSGEFLLGETEDYLLFINDTELPLSDWALVLGIMLIAAFTIFRLRRS
jgi:hypothetical protein